jgi:hypothetical protein
VRVVLIATTDNDQHGKRQHNPAPPRHAYLQGSVSYSAS